MSDEMTTRPMLEALLDGQRRISSELSELRAAVTTISEKQDALAAKLDELGAKQDALEAKQDALAAKQDALAARQEQLEMRMMELTREVRDGFYDYNRKIEALNNRLLSFEITLKRVEERLHDEILVRTR